MDKIKVGIIGAAGYTAGELIRVLLQHPKAELVTLQSSSNAGNSIDSVHHDLIGETKKTFAADLDPKEVDIAFLCKGHGESMKTIASNQDLLGIKIIDLSHDFRLKGDHDFIYGLPEINKSEIKSGNHIANPGCFATSIQMGILPAMIEKCVVGDIHISGITGSTGAGQSFSATSHFSWRNNNASVYKPFVHQHLQEIGESCTSMNESWKGQFHFIPYRGAFTRGIITTSYFDTEITDEELKEVYHSAYDNEPFTHVSEKNPDLKMVVNTNKAIVFPSVVNGKAIVISVIDNLLKGASGQAVQNMNLLFGLEEKLGLSTKASAF